MRLANLRTAKPGAARPCTLWAMLFGAASVAAASAGALSWAEQPETAKTAAQRALPANKPSLTPPSAVEGAWVSDEDAQGPYAPRGYGMPSYAPQGYAPQGYAPQAGPAYAGYGPPGYGPPGSAPQGYGPPGGGPMQGGYPGQGDASFMRQAGDVQPMAPRALCDNALTAGQGPSPDSAVAGDPSLLSACYGDSSGYDPNGGGPNGGRSPNGDYYGGDGCYDTDGDGYAGPFCGDLWTDVHSHHRWYGQVDYLYWRTKGNPLPPLVTSSPIGTLPQSIIGVLPASATTSILFGNTNVDDRYRSGGRINFGYWLVDGEFTGLEGHYFALNEEGTNFNVASVFSNGGLTNQIIARPFFNTNTGPDSLVIAAPNFVINGQPVSFDGSVSVQTRTDLQSAGLLLRNMLWIDFERNRRLDIVAGYRFLKLDDSVLINDNSMIPPFGLQNAVTFNAFDRFMVNNQFHGGEVGLRGQWFRGRVSFDALTKIAIGSTFERLQISGATSTTTLGATTTVAGATLTSPSNIGTFHHQEFAVLPEVNLQVRYDLTCNLRATAGYNFLYLSQVIRSGREIDLTVNPNGVGRPAPQFNSTEFYAHGFNAGLEYRF